jgi:hypothetical protein
MQREAAIVEQTMNFVIGRLMVGSCFRGGNAKMENGKKVGTPRGAKPTV